MPPHVVRESLRARHVHLRVSLRDGLEVVVPSGFDRTEIPALLVEKARWIERAQREVEFQRALLDPWPPNELPPRIDLRAVGETWRVDAAPAAGRGVVIEERGDRHIAARGPVTDPAVWRPALRRWLAARASSELAPWVTREASLHRLERGPVTVRWQKTRWGSCSRRAGATEPHLSLNAGLLFLPPHLVRYVILHELCHASRMDHSPEFWQRLESIEPAAQALRSELRNAWRFVPAWTAP